MRWLLVAVAAPALGQGLHFGLKAGVPLTAYYETGEIRRPFYSDLYSAATRRYTVGPSIEYRIRRHWGVEANALFKRQGYVRVNRFVSGRIAYDVKGDSWDLPLMVKYRFGRPFAAGGFALRYVGPVRARGESFDSAFSIRTPIDTAHPGELSRRWYSGLVAAVGLEFGRGRLHLQPEIRYTRWVQNIAGISDQALRFAGDQAEFLLGLLF